MSELTSKFTREDIETLIESMGDWEILGNQEWNLLQMIKTAPMPPEESEAFDYMSQIKDYFRSKERDIESSRITRQERAVFLKAKLMLVRRDMGIDQLFDMARSHSNPAESNDSVESSNPEQQSELQKLQKSLNKAEYFIRDLGVWSHYQEFLSKD